MKSLKLINIFVFLLISEMAQVSLAWQINHGSFEDWKKSIVIKPSVMINLNKFFTDNKIANLDSDVYVAAFPSFMQEKVFQDAEKIFDKIKTDSSSCPKFSKFQFPGKVSDSSVENKMSAYFEKEILRIETLDCLGSIDLEKVFAIFSSEAFQRKSISGLKSMSIDPNTNRVCQKTYILGLGTSDFCFTQDIWHSENMIVMHSFNETNQPTASAPVYFREVLTVFQKTMDNKILLYTVAYGRGPNLPFHGIIKNILSQQQSSLISQLIKEASQ